MRIIMPFPPSVNSYWRRSGNHTHISNKGREYRSNAVRQLKQSGVGSFGESRLNVSMVFHRGDKRKYDIDNYTKCALDTLMHAGIFEDDEQIDKLALIRGDIDTIGGGYVSVEIIPEK
jgi:crossover junction endodeoxyribonuclease RusA